MKIYRRSIFAHYVIWLFIFFYIFPLCYKFMGYEVIGYAAYIFAFSMGTFLLIGIARYCCYLIISEDSLIIKNVFCSSWSRVYGYKDIVKIQFFQDANKYRGPYFRVFSGTKENKRYFLECVKANDFYEITDKLGKQGVKIETMPVTEKYLKRKRD